MWGPSIRSRRPATVGRLQKTQLSLIFLLTAAVLISGYANVSPRSLPSTAPRGGDLSVSALGAAGSLGPAGQGTFGVAPPIGTVQVQSIFGSHAPPQLAAPPARFVGAHSPAAGPTSLAAPLAPNLGPAANGSANLTVGHINDGLDFSSAGQSTPPDVQFAAGPTQEAEFVNVYGEIFDLNGSSLGSFFLGTFFRTGGDYISDPKIMFDKESGRWFASILHINSGRTAVYTMLAVSSSANASGTWVVYSLPDVPGDLGDQPTLGLSSTLVGLSVNLFTSTAAIGDQFWLVNKSSVVTGSTAMYRSYGPVGTDYSLHPVQGVSPDPSLYFVMTDPASATRIALVAVTGVPPAAASFSNHSLTVKTINGPPGAPMPGTSNLLDPGDQRVQSAVYQNGSVWLVLNDQCVPAGDNAFRGCVRLTEINVTTPSVVDDFDYGVVGAYLLYPAVAVGPDGTVLLVYGESSRTIYPSIFVTGRLSGDPSGTLVPPVVLRAGTTTLTGNLCSSGGCRWGDYFGAAWSPLGYHAWFAGEYVSASTTYWTTAFAEASLSNPFPTLRLQASPSLLDLGQSTKVSFHFLNSTCGPASGVYCRVHLPLGSGSFDVSCSSPFVAAITNVTFSAPGTYAIGAGGYVAAYNGSTCSGVPMLNLSVSPFNVTVYPLPSVALTVSPSFPIDAGTPVRIAATVQGGSGGSAFAWSGGPSGCPAASGAAYSCTPTNPGVGRITVAVTDSLGSRVSASVSYTVDPDPSVSVAASVSAIETGQSVEFTAAGTGGTGLLSYRWNGLPSNCPGGNLTDVLCTVRTNGTLDVSVAVTDTLRVSGTSAVVQVLVVTAPTLSISAPVHTLVAGETLNLNAVLAGGLGPFSFNWAGLPPGCVGGGGASLQCRPTAAGQFVVVATVGDSLGGTATANLTVTVTAAPSTGSSSSASGGTIEIGILAVIAVLAVALVGAAARRSRRRP
ncbi:MAG TPA: hypothetical protein VGX00_00800 [Thermoplasmata archaeon]|nr:hypothetical protein [Thermoplasmata archaeon]